MSTTIQKVRVQCGRCRANFMEKATNVRDGFQSQCPGCGRLITFSSDSGDALVQKAMREARRARNGYVAPKSEPQLS